MKEKIKKNLLPHEKFIEYQFDHYLRKEYRDVLLHTSIIESIIIAESKSLHPFPCPNEKSKYRKFSYAIDILKKDKDKSDLLEIKKVVSLWKKRNEMIHGIMEKRYDQKQIEALRNILHNLLIDVYKLDFLNNIFENRGYPFLPKNKIIELVSRWDKKRKVVTNGQEAFTHLIEEVGELARQYVNL